MFYLELSAVHIMINLSNNNFGSGKYGYIKIFKAFIYTKMIKCFQTHNDL